MVFWRGVSPGLHGRLLRPTDLNAEQLQVNNLFWTGVYPQTHSTVMEDPHQLAEKVAQSYYIAIPLSSCCGLCP